MNVTTDPDVYKAAGTQNAGSVKYIDAVGRGSCGVNIFGTSSSCTCYRDRGDGRPTGGMWTGDCGWHESGHMMGVLDYGGNPGGTYFEGFPRYKWVPIMGNLWFSIPWKEKALLQWSKGEYATATTKSDFLAIANKKFSYREDDIPQTVPLKFTGGTQITIENNFGQIAPNTDSDGFTFEIKDAKGHAKLLIDRIEALNGAMLDVDASIVDASGKVMAQHNADSARFAQLDVDLLPGKYTLLIKGGAEGTPQTGFSSYSSLGFYGISGEITGGTTKIMNFKDLDNSVRISHINTHGKILLEIPRTSRVEKIMVYAMNGSVVYQTQLRVEAIDFSKFAAGVYTVGIAVGGTKIVRKIVKN